MDQCKSRLIKIIVFLLLVVITDQIIGNVLRYLYFHQKTGYRQSLNYSFKDCKADILIFGASQAVHNYDTRIICDSMKMTCFNAGQDGGHSILLQYAQIKIITNRYTPKIIILDFCPGSIVRYPGDYDRLEILLPYFKEFPEVRQLILLRSPYEKIKLLSAIYPFNSDGLDIIRYNTNYYVKRKKDFEGFIPLKDVQMTIDMLDTKSGFKMQEVIDTNMIIALKNIIKICKEKKIKLFIISPPLYHSVNQKQESPTVAARMSMRIIQKAQVTYHDYRFDSTFAGHMEWFKDPAHLNDKGARIFTNLLIDELKNR